MDTSYKPSINDKYKRFKREDPLPNIKPSLLNSADIKSYVDTTGMIDPFYVEDLKSASYAAKIAGKCKYWDDKKEEFIELNLDSKGDKLVLAPNAIAFVGIEPTFRLPDYIALRFNLKITHVYRGLLLGTGPLIDPGFSGKISIPLHNLTSNDYVLTFGEQLIWIEFTKTSDLPELKTSTLSESTLKSLEESRCKDFIEFPPKKTNQELDDYLTKALENTPHTTIISSVPSAVNDAIKYARDAKDSAKNAESSSNRIRRWGIAAAIGVVIGIGTLVYNSWTLQEAYFSEAVNQVSSVKQNLSHNSNAIDDNKSELLENLISMENHLLQKIAEQNKIIERLNNRIVQLENQKKKNTHEN